MTDKITMMTDYHLGCVEQVIESLQQVVNDMVQDSKLGHDYTTIASTVIKARQPLEKARKQLEKKAKERKHYLEKS